MGFHSDSLKAYKNKLVTLSQFLKIIDPLILYGVPIIPYPSLFYSLSLLDSPQAGATDQIPSASYLILTALNLVSLQACSRLTAKLSDRVYQNHEYYEHTYICVCQTL